MSALVDSTLFDLLPIGAYRTSPDGRQLRANAALARLNGYDNEQQLLEAVNDIATEWYVDPGRRQQFVDLIERDGQLVDFVSEIYRHKTRERIWVRETAHTVRDDHGHVLFYEGTVEDITATRQVQLALQTSERRFRVLIEKAQVLTVVCSADGQISYVSPASGLILGRKPESLQHSNVFNLIHPDEVATARVIHASVLANQHTGQESIFRFAHADGSWRYLAVLADNWLTDSAVAGIVLHLRDVTGRHRAETELRALNAQLVEQTHLLQTTVSSIAQGIYMIGVDNRLTLYNHRLCELLDLPEPLLATRPTMGDVLRFQLQRGDFGDQATLADEHVRQHILEGGHGDIPTHYLRRTRQGRTLEVKTQLLAEGGLVRTVADVTDYVEAEQARKRLNDLLEATQAIAQVGGWEVDMLAQTVFWTDEVYRMLDTTPALFTPSFDNVTLFFSPSAKDAVRAAFKAAMNYSKPLDMELQMVTATGRPIWVQCRSMVKVREGRVVSHTTVLQDITERKAAEQALRASEEMFRQITEQVPGMVFRTLYRPDGSREYQFISEGVRSLYGVGPDQVIAHGSLLNRFRHPDDAALIADELARSAREERPLTLQFRIISVDGKLKWVQMTSSPVGRTEQGFLRSGVMIDITERKQAEDKLRESEERWTLALESTGDGVWDWHVDQDVEYYSKNFLRMYGFGDTDLQSTPLEFDSRTHPDDIDQMRRDRQAHFDGLTPTYVNEHRVRCKDGSWKWVLSRGMVISRDDRGRPLRMIGTHTDITSRKESEALIWQQANFDALTGLPNRRMLRDRLEQEIKKSSRSGLQLAVLFIDLDQFKEVNDTLGHGTGDLLLVEAAQRIRACLGETDTVARMGGDEFTVVLSGLTDTKGLEQVLQDILKSMSSVFQVGDQQVFVSASIGITMYPTDAVAVEDLFKNADQALYQAKSAGRNRFAFFTPALQEAALTRANLTRDLRGGLAANQFAVVYQPIIDLATGAIHKAEALIRWEHPTRGQIQPAAFIGLAESSGLIIPIGQWVLEQAAAQVAQWRRRHHPQFQISVNTSPVQFHGTGGIQAGWFQALADHGLPGESLVVEITEGLLLDAGSGVSDQLLDLRRAGIQISLDDFGTGFSSLTYLQKFDIDYVKIDQSFVRNLAPASRELSLCKAIIVMAHELGMQVVAEGVETTAQHDLLLAAGCDFGQGFLYARPMPAPALDDILSLQDKAS